MPAKLYGVPYMGSKSRFAERITDNLPSKTNFVDLFAGGCAVTHRAMLSGKYQNFIVNDRDSSGIQLFVDSINGKYINEHRWISREDFFRLKDTDPYVHWCWSFGNCGRTYLYGKNLEHFKKRLFDMLYSETPYERYTAWHEVARLIDSPDIGLKKLIEGTEQLQTIERLQRLNRLTSLADTEPMKHLTQYSMDYADVEIPQDSLVYCDIPYKTTERKYYAVKFDHTRFNAWCEKFAKDRPDCELVVSEYSMPEDRFECFAQFKDRCNFSPINNSKAVCEKLFHVKQCRGTEHIHGAVNIAKE